MNKTIIGVLVLLLASPFLLIGGATIFWKLPISWTAPIAFDKATATELINFDKALKVCVKKANLLNDIKVYESCSAKVHAEFGFIAQSR